MTTEEDKKERQRGKWRHVSYSTGSAPIYGMGVLGALFYFIQHATTVPDGLIGIVKAIFWPAYLLYQVLDRFKV